MTSILITTTVTKVITIAAYFIICMTISITTSSVSIPISTTSLRLLLHLSPSVSLRRCLWPTSFRTLLKCKSTFMTTGMFMNVITPVSTSTSVINTATSSISVYVYDYITTTVIEYICLWSHLHFSIRSMNNSCKNQQLKPRHKKGSTEAETEWKEVLSYSC